MQIALVLDKKKKSYGPIAEGLLKHAPYVTYLDNFDDRYDGYIVFHNKPPHLKTDKFVAWWMCDLRPPRELQREYVDLIFLCNKHYLNDYSSYFKTQVYHLPQSGIGGEITKGRDINWDVVFIGGINGNRFHKNRHPLLTEIGKKYKTRAIFNEGHTKDTKWIYNQTPFSLAISPQVEGYTSNRLYNILASKGFCLTLYYPGIEEQFENHKHLVWFKDADEAVKWITYYKKHKEKYEQIREEGHQLYLQKHTPEQRWKFMVERSEEIISLRSGE